MMIRARSRRERYHRLTSIDEAIAALVRGDNELRGDALLRSLIIQLGAVRSNIQHVEQCLADPPADSRNLLKCCLPPGHSDDKCDRPATPHAFPRSPYDY